MASPGSNKPQGFPRKKFFVKKGFVRIRPGRPLAGGIAGARPQIVGKFHTIFDRRFGGKPTVLHWLSKAKKNLNNVKEAGDEPKDFLIRFMRRVRRALWVERSRQQQMLHYIIEMNSLEG